MASVDVSSTRPHQPVRWSTSSIGFASSAAQGLAAVATGFPTPLETDLAVHDDVLDLADIRRLQPTINATNGNEAAVLLGAATVPMLWGKLLMLFFNEFILSADAFFVSLVSNAERVGNVVINPESDWYIKISRGCSSLSNLSIGVLSWTFFVLFYDRKYGAYKFVWLAAILISIPLSTSSMLLSRLSKKVKPIIPRLPKEYRLCSRRLPRKWPVKTACG